MILSTGHYQKHGHATSIGWKNIQKNRLLHQEENTESPFKISRKYKMCFTEPEWKFTNDKHHEISNFYGLPKIHKSMVIESTINTQKSEIFEPNHL